MVKKYKKTLILTSLLTLLPILVGLILWDKMPEKFATHWGMDGQADGWSSLPFAVFSPPIIMLAVQWLCIWVTAKDPGNKDRNHKPLAIVLWIIPVISNLCCGMMYALALGADLDILKVMVAAIGLMFVIIGNYLPKCKMNSTLGIKISWAYTSEENWNATHRFGGKVWLIGGLLIMLCGLLPGSFGVTVMLIAIFALAFTPMVYSWRYYRRQLTRGDALDLSKAAPMGKAGKYSLIAVVILLAAVAVVMFTGSIDVHLEEEAMVIEASWYHDLTVDYAVIESAEYRQGNVDGTRVGGFGSAKLLMGYFHNDEFGTYTRYTTTRPEACIVVYTNNDVLILSGDTLVETQFIYDGLMAEIG